MTKVKPIPEGFHSITPFLIVDDGSKAVDFYKQALGAQVMERHNKPDGKLMHASLKIGDSVIMLGTECESPKEHDEVCLRSPKSLEGTSTNLYLYVENVDEFFNKAVKAGAKVTMPVTDMFWGDRMGQFKDPSGHSWSVATQKERVEPKELEKRMAKCMEKSCEMPA